MNLINVHGPKLKYYINRFGGIGMENDFMPKQILVLRWVDERGWIPSCNL